nr:uncharacterized protein LOC100340711 isoform X3 [Oryctolagus cuniculus]
MGAEGVAGPRVARAVRTAVSFSVPAVPARTVPGPAPVPAACCPRPQAGFLGLSATLHHGPGALPGPDVPALPRRLHLRQEKRDPLSAVPRGSAQSVAILLYLSRKYKAPDHWYPQDLQARARVDEYLSWQHTTLRSCCTRATWQKLLFPVFLGQAVPPETLAATLAELDRCLQLLEDKFLRDQPFLAGPRISVADLVAITELMHLLSLQMPAQTSRVDQGMEAAPKRTFPRRPLQF